MKKRTEKVIIIIKQENIFHICRRLQADGSACVFAGVRMKDSR